MKLITMVLVVLAVGGCAIFSPVPGSWQYQRYMYYVHPYYRTLQSEQNEQTDRRLREDMNRVNIDPYRPVVMPTYTTPQIPVLPTDSCGAACEPVTVPRETLPQQNFYQSQPTQSQSDEQAIVCANSPPGTPGCQE